MQLRNYQRETVDALHQYLASEEGNPLVVAPTASGKSYIIAAFIQETLDQSEGKRILILTHVKELIEQNYRELVNIWSWAPAGIYSAGLRRKETWAPIIFAGIQSIHDKAERFRAFDYVLVDECHLVPRKSNTMYRSFLEALKKRNPALKVIGLTATHYRLDSGLLTEGDDRIFTDIAVEIPLLRLIDEGFLCRLVSKHTKTEYDLSGVHTRGGEYIPDQLSAAMDQSGLTQSAIREILHYGSDRKSWLVFCSGIAHAEHVRDALIAQGIKAACITSKTPQGERDRMVRDFRAGSLRALTNCDVLTTGFNAPGTDLLVMLRPTKSTGLYVQIAGRGMRICPDREKKDCLVLDFAGNVAYHGPIDHVDPRRPRAKGTGEAPVKICPNCSSIIYAGFLKCPDCGYVFPVKSAHFLKAADLPILSDDRESDLPVGWIPVRDVFYSRYQKADKPPTLRVTYLCAGGKQYQRWIPVEGDNDFAKLVARRWFVEHGIPYDRIPKTVNEALKICREFKVSRAIQVRPDGKYIKVVKCQFEEAEVPDEPPVF